MCPGHFDMSPSQITQLWNCKLLLCFDFQKGIEKQLSRARHRGLKTALVSETSGLCVPQTYLAICRQVADILSNEYPQRKLQFQDRLAAIEKEIGAMDNELTAQIRQASLAGAVILASRHQADFVKWLGLDVVGTFAGSDSETVSKVGECLRQAQGRDVRFVVANKQEGTALAEALAERLGARAVVFSNFPQIGGRSAGFYEMVRANVHTLIEAAGG